MCLKVLPVQARCWKRGITVSEWVCDNLGAFVTLQSSGNDDGIGLRGGPNARTAGEARCSSAILAERCQESSIDPLQSIRQLLRRVAKKAPQSSRPGLMASGQVTKAAARTSRFELAGSRQPRGEGAIDVGLQLVVTGTHTLTIRWVREPILASKSQLPHDAHARSRSDPQCRSFTAVAKDASCWVN